GLLRLPMVCSFVAKSKSNGVGFDGGLFFVTAIGDEPGITMYGSDLLLLSAYAHSMPPLLSLPLSMPRDDSDGCATIVTGDDDNLPFTMRSSSTPVSWLGSRILSYCRFDVGLHEPMMSLGVGKLKDEVICTLARQLTEVAAMADVLRFATLLSLIYVGVLSLPAQRRNPSNTSYAEPHGSNQENKKER
ncbi:hypothetical protein Tco_1413938, partial [Tanacetum coccineum]